MKVGGPSSLQNSVNYVMLPVVCPSHVSWEKESGQAFTVAHDMHGFFLRHADSKLPAWPIGSTALRGSRSGGPSAAGQAGDSPAQPLQHGLATASAGDAILQILDLSDELGDAGVPGDEHA